jgi:hypothetical protein
VQLDGADSTEVWGVFRAGRRARVSGLSTRVDSAGLSFDAAHDGFRRLPGSPRHRRRWSLAEGGLRIDDLISGRGRHEIVVRWQLAVGWAVQVTGDTASISGTEGAFTAAVAASCPARLAVQARPVAAGFGSTADAPVLTCTVNAYLPVGVTTTWSRAPDGADSERMS